MGFFLPGEGSEEWTDNPPEAACRRMLRLNADLMPTSRQLGSSSKAARFQREAEDPCCVEGDTRNPRPWPCEQRPREMAEKGPSLAPSRDGGYRVAPGETGEEALSPQQRELRADAQPGVREPP